LTRTGFDLSAELSLLAEYVRSNTRFGMPVGEISLNKKT